ncbi:MAG TPA: hypothetical protein VFR76_08975 [Verrucomicrobiae bacterium]|nr:hypothetical protein [Verrucomicrobiae bacterium]
MIFVGVEFPPPQQITKSRRARDNFLFFFFRRPQLIQRRNFQAAHKVQGAICHQTCFCESNRDREIGDDAIAISFARVAVETGRKIDRKDISALFLAQLVDVTAGYADRITQRWFGAQSKQAIENDDWGTTAQISFGPDGVLRSRQLIGHVCPKFDKSDAEVGPAAAGWPRTQNLGWPAPQAFELLAH